MSLSKSAETTPSAVAMRGIIKHFPGVLANDGIDFAVQAGEIHALLGENGAGKSTLMNILTGLYRADEGEIALHGQRVDIRSPRDAIARGIGMVHQHFMLVEPLTVTENIVLGLSRPRFALNMKRAGEDVEALARRYGLKVDAHAYIWQLSVGEQQRVEILKMLYRGADILILDEPTAVLTPHESGELGRTLRQMAAEGKAIIFITHKLDEVAAFSDRVTVLRRGHVVATLPTAETTRSDLARLMVGREVLFRLEKEAVAAGEAVLDVQELRALGDKGLPALQGISLQVRAGEILGVAGVAGNGQRELAEVLTGLRKASAGRVLVGRREITNRSPRLVIDEGVAHVPGDRLGMGLVPNLAVSDNLILKSYRQPPICGGLFLRRDCINEHADSLIAAYDIATPSLATPVKLLSGGNLQKCILAREIAVGRGLLVAVHPTRGLDVGATEAVRRTLLEQRAAGMAILLISEDLDELLAISDRVAVIYEGQIMGVMDAASADLEEIGLMMAGAEARTSNLKP